VAKQEIEEAVKAHLKAIELNPAGFVDDNFDTRLNFYVSINRTEDLITALQEAVNQYPEQSTNRGKILWAIGHTYLRAGNIDQANKYLQEAIAQGYDNTQAYIEIGDTYLAQEQYSHAEQAYQLALAKNTNLPQVHSSLGYIYAKTGRLDQAIEANNKVLESLPRDYDSNKNLALLYQQAGQLEQALNHAKIALEVAPEAAKEELRRFISQLEQQLQQKQPESSND
jgi:tetratricopeptide (TPR) repeat protein